MQLFELSKMYPDLNVKIKLGELKEAVEFCIRMTYNEITQREKEEDTFPTPTEVTKLLGVSRSTLWRWAKQNYLMPIEVGGKRRYRMSDVKALLNGSQKDESVRRKK